jgi:hypothetical protein
MTQDQTGGMMIKGDLVNLFRVNLIIKTGVELFLPGSRGLATPPPQNKSAHAIA